jgi:hypothetical protein
MSSFAVEARSLLPGVVVGAGAAAVFAWAVSTNSYNVWGAVIVVPVVVAVNLLLIWQVAQRNAAEPRLGRLLGFAFAAKMLGTLARYAVAYVVYNGQADAERYNLFAAHNFRAWREGQIAFEWNDARGTKAMELITTALYTVTGPTTLAAFFVYASFAFWGAYLMYRAFRVALPDGNHTRYAALVLFLPSMLFWPSSIGKESWLMLFVGVTALGAAKFFAHERGAYALLAAGAVGASLIRPHVAVLLFASLLVAQLFRPATSQATGILLKIGGVAVMGVAAWVLTQQSAAFLGTEDISLEGISSTLAEADRRSTQGGSAFTPVSMSNPLGFPAAAVTVLFRPFPFEAHNLQMLMTSVEGVFLLGLTIASWPRLRRLPSLLRHNPYVVFALVYVTGFIVAFSSFGNFGILARQRVLMLPFFLVLLALPQRRKNESDRMALERAEREEDDAPRGHGVFRSV